MLPPPPTMGAGTPLAELTSSLPAVPTVVSRELPRPRGWWREYTSPTPPCASLSRRVVLVSVSGAAVPREPVEVGLMADAAR